MKILLKISWEALKSEGGSLIDPSLVEEVVSKIKEIKKIKNLQLAIVIGWWNIYRWSDLIKSWVNSSDSHSLSMLSTVFNWVVLKNFLENVWIKSVVMDPNWINFLEKYNKDRAKKYLENWIVTIFTWGTGNPYFTTDSWWVLRALEIGCDMMIKATKVDWVYDKDPVKNEDAKFYENISYDKVISKDLKILDTTAIVLAKDWNLKIKVVKLFKDNSIVNAITWNSEWTTIS
jgi:uridylate kinase